MLRRPPISPISAASSDIMQKNMLFRPVTAIFLAYIGSHSAEAKKTFESTLEREACENLWYTCTMVY